MGHTWWTALQHGDLITISKAVYPAVNGITLFESINPILIWFTKSGRKAIGWTSGETWELRFKKWEYSDPGKLFSIQLHAQPLLSPIPLHPYKVSTAPAKPEGTRAPISTTETPHSGMPSGPGPLVFLLSTFLVLNTSKPRMAGNCWLCLDTDSSPPIMKVQQSREIIIYSITYKLEDGSNQLRGGSPCCW